MSRQRTVLLLVVFSCIWQHYELKAFTVKLNVKAIETTFFKDVQFRVALAPLHTVASWDTVFTIELPHRSELRTPYVDTFNTFTFTGIEPGEYRLYITDKVREKFKIVDRILVQKDLDLGTIHVFRFDYGLRGCVKAYVPSGKYSYYNEETKYRIEGAYKTNLRKGTILEVGEWRYYKCDTLTKIETYNRKGDLNGAYYLYGQSSKVYGQLKNQRLIDQWTFVLADGRKLYSTFLYDPRLIKQKTTRWSEVYWPSQWYIEYQIWQP